MCKGLIREKQVTVEIFEDYVLSAKEEYVKYKLCVDNKELNKYLIDLIEKLNDKQSLLLYYIHKDKRYNLDELKKAIEETIKQGNTSNNVHTLTYIYRILSLENGIIATKFSQSIINQEIQELKNTRWGQILEKGYEDIIAISLSYGIDIANIDDRVIPRVCECMEKYMPYSEVMKNLGSDTSAFRLLNTYIIQNQKCVEFNPRDAAQRTQQMIQGLEVTAKELFTYFNRFEIDEEWQTSDMSSCDLIFKGRVL